jgi:hypothetical protein
MKNFKSKLLLFITIIFIINLGSCSLQKVKKTPIPSSYDKIDNIKTINGYSKVKQPWVIFSDRENNPINPTVKDQPHFQYKEGSFLQPFFILKEKNGMIKIAEFEESLLNDGKIPQDKKLKVLGWLPKDRILLWNNSLKKSETGFTLKATTVVNNQKVFSSSEKYIENDSIVIYSTPDLTKKLKLKIPIGSLVYIYKQSSDKTRYLIGKKPSTTFTEVKNNIIGWVDRDILAIWGDKSSLKIKNKDSVYFDVNNNIKNIGINSKYLNNREGLENIYPIYNMKNSEVNAKYFTNIFNYDLNKIYNVLGNPIYYQNYLKILKKHRKLNVIFVLDISKNNKLYFPLAKSLMQELQLNFTNPDYFNSIKFGGVVYKNNSCNIENLSSSLNTNYREVALFFEKKTEELKCEDNDIGQPLGKGILSATKMLNGLEEETNLIIIIGTTVDQGSYNSQTINSLTKTRSKLVFFQTHSKVNDTYNDFVLFSETNLLKSAENIVELKKEKIVDQKSILEKNTYNLIGGETGQYYLDYPKKSMTQGYVVFPKKGEVMSASFLKTSIDTMLVQIKHDNKSMDQSLTNYFKSEIGVNNTFLKKEFKNIFPVKDSLIPIAIASSLINKNSSFLINGKLRSYNKSLENKVEYGMLLNDQEYEYLKSYYFNVYNELENYRENGKRKIINKYLKFLSKNSQTINNIKISKLNKNTMSENIKFSVGFPKIIDSTMQMTIKSWKKNKKINAKHIFDFIKQHKDIATKLVIDKSDDAIIIRHHGQVLYWLNEEYVPKLKIDKQN